MNYFVILYLIILCFFNIVAGISGLSILDKNCSDNELFIALRTMLSFSIVFITLYISIILCLHNELEVQNNQNIPVWFLLLTLINTISLLILNAVCLNKIENCGKSSSFKALSGISLCLIIFYLVYIGGTKIKMILPQRK